MILGRSISFRKGYLFSWRPRLREMLWHSKRDAGTEAALTWFGLAIVATMEWGE